MRDLYGDFLGETAQGVTRLKAELHRLDGHPADRDLLAAVFRHVHSIKGTCGFLGLRPLEERAHELEAALVELRDGTRVPDAGARARLLGLAEGMQSAVAELAAGAGNGGTDLWALLPGLVADLSARLGKQTDLRVTGDIGALDGRLLVAARDCLIHIIRNAVDHAIEPPVERARLGKPPGGMLHIEVRRKGADVVVAIADDGRGLDLPALRRQALRRGPAEAQKIAVMADAELAGQVFAPGVSTAGSVTAISGRGVGLDAVQAAVRGLGGAVEVDSAPGRGTRFILRLPAEDAGRSRRAVRC
jgi:two-component system chemotaxis sensor kinase CheA